MTFVNLPTSGKSPSNPRKCFYRITISICKVFQSNIHFKKCFQNFRWDGNWIFWKIKQSLGLLLKCRACQLSFCCGFQSTRSPENCGRSSSCCFLKVIFLFPFIYLFALVKATVYDKDEIFVNMYLVNNITWKCIKC